MSERFEKTYISIQEFIASWEKEIYEFTNLDYFTYLLINHLGNRIENEFFKQLEDTPYLRIDPEEIGTLSFNIGDSFESFLENNCFGDCSLSCPTNLNEKFTPEELDTANDHLHILQLVNGEDLNRRQFLLTDILNYVVLDTLFDFYNYEMGMDLDDADVGLMQFADFITVILENFIDAKGQQLLTNHRESAGEIFEGLVQENNESWNESAASHYDEEGEEIETWKIGNLAIKAVIQEYCSQLKLSQDEAEVAEKLLLIFQNYAENYAGLKKADEITVEDLEEFFLFWLVRELSLEKQIGTSKVRQVYSKFLKWLELSKDLDLNESFSKLLRKHYQNFRHAVLLARKYIEKNSVIDGLLEVNAADVQIVDGVFQVERVSNNGFLHLKDVHFNNRYQNVQINFPYSHHLFQKTIFDACLKPTLYGWRVVHLEYIFPIAARPYLH